MVINSGSIKRKFQFGKEKLSKKIEVKNENKTLFHVKISKMQEKNCIFVEFKSKFVVIS
jgi:hypothetical protein